MPVIFLTKHIKGLDLDVRDKWEGAKRSRKWETHNQDRLHLKNHFSLKGKHNNHETIFSAFNKY